jgi:asparagine synthase (glutamine-hydrolysing)
MCGITGLLRGPASDTAQARGLVARMTDALVHRGPDAGAVWSSGPVALGHRRLSILDLSDAGAQPMHSACGRYVLAYNGEIYNHLDLRALLDAAGAAPDWRGHSDTETLLAGIVHWGLAETLTRAMGMFALALWDQHSGHLSLARDRMGEKPLYWGWAGADLVFASELKAIRAHPHAPRDICRNALAQYLALAYVPAPYSIHTGLYKLEPGCILRVEGPVPATHPSQPLRPGQSHGSLSVLRYWSLDDAITAGRRDPVADPQAAVAMTEATLRDAVARQMLSDVPLGAFLSGGVDSSVIVALMQAQSLRPVRSFTIGFERADYDESPQAAAVAQHLGTEHTALTVTEADARAVIPRLPQLYDEPFADSSQIPTYLVCGAARRAVTVALSGDGGDELFGGYNRHIWVPRLTRRLGPLPVGLRRALGGAIRAVPMPVWDGLGALGGRRFGLRRAGHKAHRLAARMEALSSPEALYRSILCEWQASDLLPAPLRDALGPLQDPLPDALTQDPAAMMMLQDMRCYLPDDILCKVDRAAMGVSLETRVPFLDPKVIALSARLPTDLKIRHGQGKWVLRQVLYRHVPQALIERPKTGFGIPVGEWLRGPLRPWAEDLLSPESLARDGLFNPAPIRTAWAEHLSGRHDWTVKLWIILMFLAWRAEQS